MRLTRLVALLAVLALFLMACEADDPDATELESTPTPAETATPTPEDDTGAAVDDDVLERVTQAAANTVDEGTARFTVTVGAPRGTTGGTTGTTGTEDDDTSGTTGTTGTTGTEDDITVEGEVDFDEELRELQFVGPDGRLTMILDGDELYVMLPATEEGEWARVDLSELADEDISFGGPAGIPFQDPHRTLDVLREAAVEARELDGQTGASPTPTETGDDGFGASPTPTETGDDGFGASPTPGDMAAAGHFLVVIDLEQASDLTAGGGRQFAAMAEQHGIETLDMEIWIDDQERIERITYTLPLSESSVGTGTETEATGTEATETGATATETETTGTETGVDQDLSVTIDYYDFGTELDITVPDEDEVVDVDEQELRRMLEQGGTGTGTTGRPGTTTLPTPTPTGTASPTPTGTASPTPTGTPTD